MGRSHRSTEAFALRGSEKRYSVGGALTENRMPLLARPDDDDYVAGQRARRHRGRSLVTRVMRSRVTNTHVRRFSDLMSPQGQTYWSAERLYTEP